jgi:hypothetical protein
MSWRIIAAVASLVSAWIHFDLWRSGTAAHVALVNGAFVLNAIAGVVIAVLLLAWRSWVPAFLVAGFGLSTLGALVIASTVGLFGYHEAWTGPFVWISAIAEVVCIGTGARLLMATRPSDARLQHHAA